jgi:hypothetical protein
MQNATNAGFTGGTLESELQAPKVLSLQNQGAGWADYLIDVHINPFSDEFTDATRILVHWDSNGHTDGGETIFLSGTYRPDDILKGKIKIIKFQDDDGDGIKGLDEPILGEGWQFEISGGDLTAPIALTTDANGETIEVELGLAAGGDYLVTEVGIPAGYAGWYQTTNDGNAIPVTVGGGINPPVFVGNIPEPAAMALVILGGFPVLVRRRRRRRR